jgi:probable biosynthetic protein (TIGR04098 family)
MIEDKIKTILGGIANVDPANIASDAKLGDIGIASLDILIVRESLERVFSIFVTENDVKFLNDVPSIVDLITSKESNGSNVLNSVVPVSENVAVGHSGDQLGPNDVLYSDLEIGMHLTGRNNLAETPLLREMGHLRWMHMSLIAKVPSKDVVDEDGERLYPTFFFVEMAFPPSRSMATYGENDRFTIASTLRRYGLSMLDGEHFLFPSHWPESRKIPLESKDEAMRQGVPYVRFSNSFVRQWKGAEWLKRSRPANPGFTRIREMTDPPDSYEFLMGVKEGEPVMDVPEGYVPLTPEPVEFEYKLIPDRDLNGAGLVYFANYPTFLDIAEREVLSNAGELALDDSLLDLRTLVYRKSAYLSNATCKDSLRIRVAAWIENPFLSGRKGADMMPIRLFLTHEMRRSSDDRLMQLSAATKVITGRTLGDTDLPDLLKDRTP